MKNLILLFTFCLVAVSAQAQSIASVEPNEMQQERAAKVAEAFSAELGLTAKQMMLVEKKYAEFMAKQSSVMTSKRTLANKNDVLQALHVEQGREMNDILTGPQRNKYKDVIPNVISQTIFQYAHLDIGIHRNRLI